MTRDRRRDRMAVHQNRLVVVVGQRPAGTGGNQPEVTGHHHPNTPFRIGAKGNFCPSGGQVTVRVGASCASKGWTKAKIRAVRT